MLIIAHRGASAEAPENTLAAFRRAIEVGADGVEFDVRLAADGVPVVIHDATLERVAGLKRRVADLTSSDLAKIDAGSLFKLERRQPGGNASSPPARGGVAEGRGGGSRERAMTDSSWSVPTLRRTLDVLNDLRGPVYVEIKIDHTHEVAPLTHAVARVISGSPLLPEIIIQSFDLRVLTSIRKHLPDIQTAALFGSRLSHFVGGRRRIVDLAIEHGATHLSLHQSVVTRRMAARAAAANLLIAVWTVNNPAWLQRASELGVYAVITNDPARLTRPME